MLHVCIYICIYRCIHTCIHIDVYIYIHIFTNTFQMKKYILTVGATQICLLNKCVHADRAKTSGLFRMLSQGVYVL